MGHLKELFVIVTADDHEARWRPRKMESEFLCPICNNVLDSPTQFQPCQHAVCGSCISNRGRGKKRASRQSGAICPVVNCHQRVTSYEKPQRLFMSLLNNLKLKCPYTMAGCTLVLSLGNLEDHDQVCEFNPENQKECEGGCGLVLNQQLRQSGNHNCVQYLKSQLNLTKGELAATKGKLTSTANNLEISQRELEAMQQQQRHVDDDTDTDDEDVNDDDPTESRPSPPKRTRSSLDRPVVTCIEKWGLTDEEDREYFGDILELLGLYVEKARKYAGNLVMWGEKLNQFHYKIRMCLRHASNLYFGSATWKNWTEADGREVAASAVNMEQPKPDCGMIFKVDYEFRVEIFLNRSPRLRADRDYY